MSKKNDISSVFRVPGLGTLENIRMGPGVVGRTATVVISFLVFSIVVLWIFKDILWVSIPLAAIVILLIVGYVCLAFWYASKFPNHAVMDGAQIVRYAEIEQAAKNPKIINTSAEPVANTAPPISITDQGGRDA